MSRAWWRDAVIYEVYPRSFADGNGDGDRRPRRAARRGCRTCADLGVDAIWIAPWYPSPMADGGYDVTDHRDIDPMFGTLADADALPRRRPRARPAGDRRPRRQPHLRPAPLVPRGARGAARLAGAGALLLPRRPRPRTATNRRTTGSAPSAARPGPGSPSRTAAPASGTCTCSRPSSPTSTGRTRRSATSSTASCGSGSTAASTASASTPPPRWPRPRAAGRRTTGGVPLVRDGRLGATTRTGTSTHVHAILRRWRARRRQLRGDRVFVAEAVVERARAAQPVPAPRRDAHGVQLRLPEGARGTPAAARRDRRHAGRRSRRSARPRPGCWAATTRPARSRGTAGPTTGVRHIAEGRATPSDLALGTRRARAAALLMLALPGGAYVYQGEELGLPEVEDLPDDRLQDPLWRPFRPHRSAAATAAGCRCPGRATARRSGSPPDGARRGSRSPAAGPP